MNIGDRVRDITSSGATAGRTGVLVEPDPKSAYPYLVKYDEDPLGRGAYRADELELVEPQFVNVTTARSIWVTLPGDNAGHRLTEDEARALFRQLEEVV